jgi:hypothetical protein
VVQQVAFTTSDGREQGRSNRSRVKELLASHFRDPIPVAGALTWASATFAAAAPEVKITFD